MKSAAFVAATAIVFGIGGVSAAPASATDNIKPFGVQMRLNGPNSLPYIGYTVTNFAPSKDPVPHNGKLYGATLVVDGFGGNHNPMIERFGARAESGEFYPAIRGASNMGNLYFDIVGPIPNSVVWNDGVRDILAWIPGTPSPADMPEVVPTESEVIAPAPESVPNSGAMPAEADPALVATPNDLARPPFELTEAEVATPGFNR